MRVLLVKSRSIVSKNSGVTPPLGLMYLASVLRSRLAADVRILDLKFCRQPVGDLMDVVRGFAPDIVGLSALTAEAHLARECARAVKSLDPSMPLLAGGPHASSFVEETLSPGSVDVAVVGEGEETMLDLARLIAADGPSWKTDSALAGIPGIAFVSRDSGKIVLTAPRPAIEDLDSLPFPAWDLVDLPSYWKLPSMATIGIRPYMTVFTSRGCPFHCSYCHNLFGKRFRARSAQNVVAEIVELRQRFGVDDLEVIDDISNFDEARLRRILMALQEAGSRPVLNFPNGIRADLMTPEMVEHLSSAGVGEVSIAVESASPRIQTLIRKRLNLDNVRRTIGQFARRGVLTRGFFMLGFPTESAREMRHTIDFACESPLHLALFFTVNPFKGTLLRKQFEEAGKLCDSACSVDYEYYGAPFNGSDVPAAQFRAIYRSAYARFYGNPARAFRILRDRPYKRDIPRRAWLIARNLASFRRLRESA